MGGVLVFYMMRWLSPLIGVLLLAFSRFDEAYSWTAAGSLLVAVAIFVGALLVTESQPLARRLGRWAGRVAVPIRRAVDPEEGATSVGGFQPHIADRFRRGLVLSLPVLVVQVLVDAGILVLAARFVGVGPGELSWVEIMAAFLVASPLTLFPLQGIGILDATVVAELTAVGGVHLEAALVPRWSSIAWSRWGRPHSWACCSSSGGVMSNGASSALRSNPASCVRYPHRPGRSSTLTTVPYRG